MFWVGLLAGIALGMLIMAYLCRYYVLSALERHEEGTRRYEASTTKYRETVHLRDVMLTEREERRKKINLVKRRLAGLAYTLSRRPDFAPAIKEIELLLKTL